MATTSRRFTTSTTGPDNLRPVAILANSKIDTIIGAIIQLDGRQSYDPEKQPLTHRWRFVQVPIGSEVAPSGFKNIRPNATAVSFIPDKTGIYVVELIVNDGEFDSLPTTATVSIQLSRVPCGENIIPDAQFLWNYISDFWKLVEDREKIASIWSSVIQLLGADTIKLWGNDYNKSLSTIQATYQRRWQKFDMVTDLSTATDQRVIVGKTDSGVGGASGNLGTLPGVGFTSVFAVPLGRPGDGDRADFTNLEGNYGAKGRVIVVNGTTYTIDRVANQNTEIVSADDLQTYAGSSTVTSAGNYFEEVLVGDLLTIKTGLDAEVYKVKQVFSPTSTLLVYPADPAAGPIPALHGASGVEFRVDRQFTLAVVNESVIPEGQVGATWRVPHLLHTPGVDLESAGVRAGDVLVLEVVRSDIGLTSEIQVQVVGSDGERLGFELSMQDLFPDVNSGEVASIVESGSVVTVSGLANMRPTSVGGYLEILNGDNPGAYKITQYVSEDAVVVDNVLASGPDSVNPAIQWIERAKSGTNIDRTIFQKIVRDLRIVPASAGDSSVDEAAGALIRFMPVGINLFTRPFSKYGIKFRAKRVIHNTSVKISDDVVGVPALQESVVDPPVVLRENLDYVVDSGYLTFVSGLFTITSPAPDQLWAECVILDNSPVVEKNFGRFVDLTRDDLSKKRTRAGYLNAVRGLFFAFTSGPKVANIRLGLQILLGLPFSEEAGVVLEIQEDFSVDTSGNSLGRMLVEDVDETTHQRTGIRRVYLYPMSVGLDVNPSTGQIYKVGDPVKRFAPISKGIDVVDYIKDPLWWKRSLYGLEILKFFTFRVFISSSVFDSNDVAFGLEFIRKIKPAYTKVIATALLELSDDIDLLDLLGGVYLTKFYENTWGLEAVNRVGDQNHQGAVLWNAGSKPFSTRSEVMLTDLQTIQNGTYVEATSAMWDTTLLRGRNANPGTPVDRPTIEGDIIVIQQGQLGAGITTPGYYEIDSILSTTRVRLRSEVPMTDPVTLDTALLDSDLFRYGATLRASILRRASNPMLVGYDLSTTLGSNLATSVLAKFVTNLVSPGDHLVIETGLNMGEYVIDQIPVLECTADATVDFDAGSIVSGGTVLVFDSSMVGKQLVIRDSLGIHQGAYLISSISGPHTALFLNPRGTTGSITPGDWYVAPVSPFISETQVALKNYDGTLAVLQTVSNQQFRVVKSEMSSGTVYQCQSVYNVVEGRMELEVYDQGLADPRDVFTPGMVGLTIQVSESDHSINDGSFLIVGYLNSGRVVTDSTSTTSDTDPVSKISFVGVP
jgi:hypothetical protein